MKQLICFQLDMQRKMYEAHRDDKLARCHQIRMMHHMGLQVSDGSAENLIPEDKWISKFSNWELADDHAGTTSSAPPLASEESEESEEEDDE